MEQKKPWSFVKEDQQKASAVLGTLTEVVRHLSLMIQPIMPQAAEKIGLSLGISHDDVCDLKKAQQWRVMPFRSIIKGEALFPLHSNAKE